MNYVKVLIISCVLSACGAAPIKPVAPQMLLTTDMELADEKELAAQHLSSLRIEKLKAEVLKEQINMLKINVDQQITILGKCNTLIDTYEQLLIAEEAEEEEAEEGEGEDELEQN